MSGVEFVAVLVGILAWPATVLTVVLLLRPRREASAAACVRRLVGLGKPRRVAEQLTTSAETLGYDLEAFGLYVEALGEVPADDAKIDRLRRRVVRGVSRS